AFWFRHFLSARNRRDDGDFVAVLNLRRLAVEESDVFIVEEDVHETADLAGLVADALLEAGKAPVEIVEDFADRRACGLDDFLFVGEFAEWGWDADAYHVFSGFRFG